MSDSGNVPQTGIIKRLETLIELAMARTIGGLQYLLAARKWAAGSTNPIALTNAWQVIVDVPYTPKTTGKLRIKMALESTADGTADHMNVGVSIGSGIIVPIYALASSVSVPANATGQCVLIIDLDQLGVPTVLPVGVATHVNVLGISTTGGHLTVPTGGAQIEIVEGP